MNEVALKNLYNKCIKSDLSEERCQTAYAKCYMPYVKFPRYRLVSKRFTLISIFHVAIIVTALYLGISLFNLFVGFLLYILLIFIWAFSRTIPRARRYEEHLKQFGSPFDASQLEIDKVIVSPLPFEGATVMTSLYWHEGDMVFGVRNTYRKLLLADVDVVNELEVLGHPVMHIKLKGGKWEDNFYLPIDITFRSR